MIFCALSLVGKHTHSSSQRNVAEVMFRSRVKSPEGYVFRNSICLLLEEEERQ